MKSVISGKLGEDIAARFLVGKGYHVVCRNWRCRQGEIDLVCRDGRELVFLEVKTRRSLAFGGPADGVGCIKLRRFRHAISAYLSQEPKLIKFRIDCVLIWLANSRAKICHLKNIEVS